MPRVEFEPTTAAFEGVKAVHALDRAATLIGYSIMYFRIKIVTNQSDILIELRSYKQKC
jgi:hypothetical protein